MTIEQFAEITQRIIDRDGFDGYLPTAYYPERKHVVVLEGIPLQIDAEMAARDWACKNARPGELFLVAFKSDPHTFKVVRYSGSDVSENTFPVRES